MDSFPKINSALQELHAELSTLKKELDSDVNYSSSHADIVSSVESAEEMLHEFEIQMRNIESDANYLNENIDENRFGYDGDEDDIINKMYAGYDDEDA